MILSSVSVLILVMSPVLGAVLVAPNSLSLQEISDYCVNYTIVTVFVFDLSIYKFHSSIFEVSFYHYV